MTLWQNQLSCGNVRSEHTRAAYDQREGYEEDSRILRGPAIQRRIFEDFGQPKQIGRRCTIYV